MPIVHNPGHTPAQSVARGDTWCLEQQGNLLAVAVKRAVVPEMPDVPRSAIAEFTRASRLRLLKLLARTDWEAVGHCLFLTCTYPDECIEKDYALRTQHRGQLLRDIRKYLGIKPTALWRIEWKPRLSGKNQGMLAPHMHVCLFTTRWIPKKLLRQWWGRIIGHAEPLCWIRFRRGKAAAEYAAKYAAKEECLSGLANNAYPDGMTNGRRWGISRRDSLPLCPQRYMMGLSPGEQAQCEALAEQTLGVAHKGGFVILADEAAELFDKILMIGNTPIACGDAWEGQS